MSDPWYMLTDKEKYAYHYTKSCSLARHILADGRLRFSRFSVLNDPREMKEWVFSYAGVPPWFDLASTESIGAQMNELLKRSWCIGCFVSDPPEAVMTKEVKDEDTDPFGPMYERGHSRPRMWAQYGEDYAGACLVFDKAQLHTAVKAAAKAIGSPWFAGKVAYRNPRVARRLGEQHVLTIVVGEVLHLGVEQAAALHVQRHWRDLFFLKSRDWEQEHEFRWLVHAPGDGHFHVDIRNALVGIALGDRFPEKHLGAVKHYARANARLSVAELHWKNGLPQPMPTPWG